MLDIAMIKKFARLKITAPVFKSDLEGTITELEELMEDLQEKGDQEKEFARQKFLKEIGEETPKEEKETPKPVPESNGQSKYKKKEKPKEEQ